MITLVSSPKQHLPKHMKHSVKSQAETHVTIQEITYSGVLQTKTYATGVQNCPKTSFLSVVCTRIILYTLSVETSSPLHMCMSLLYYYKQALLGTNLVNITINNKFSTVMTSPGPALQKCTGFCHENVPTPYAVSSNL